MHEPGDLDNQIDALIGGDLDPEQRQQLLERLAWDEQARQQLAASLQQRRDLRAAFGYDRAGADIAQQLPGAYEQLQARAEVGQRQHKRRWWFGVGLKIAAMLALVVSLTLAWRAHRTSDTLQQQLSQLKQQREQPRMQLSAKDARRYRTLWKQVAAGIEPWLLVSGGDGQFGSLTRSQRSPGTNAVVALRWRIEDDSRKSVYEGTLLLPEGRRVSVDVAADDTPFNRPLMLSSNTTQPYIAGVWLKMDGQRQVGVAGRVPPGPQNRRIGTFHHDETQYHVYVQRQRLNHAGPAI